MRPVMRGGLLRGGADCFDQPIKIVGAVRVRGHDAQPLRHGVHDDFLRDV